MVGCHRCGGRSRTGARFCGACGTVLGSARAGVRKTVTVLFAHATLTSARGLVPPPEDLESGVRVVAAFYERMREVLEEYGGTVERHAGDAVMAVFGVPVARDDDARRASAAALALQEVARTLAGNVTFSIGINTGEVLTGDSTNDEELAVGDPVVVAARIQQQAAPGEVLLGPATARLLDREAVVGLSRDIGLRGRVGTLPVVPLLGLDACRDVGLRGPFVGRDAERGVLLAALDRTVTTPIAQLVSVLGEAGVGKSRLVREVLRERSQSLVVATGTCRGYGDQSTWSALVEVLHDLTGTSDGPKALAALEASYPELALVLPILASLLGDGKIPVNGADLAWAVARVLVAAGRERPLAVVLEDLHLAESSLLELLPAVVRHLEGCPVVLVTTGRPELLEHCPDWGRGLRHVVGLTVRPLSEQHARALAEHLLADDLEGVDALINQAGGNPLFLAQLAQARAEGTGDAALSVSAVLAARLDRLPLEARAVLERAAVVGSRGRIDDLLPLCEGEQEIDVEAELVGLSRRDLLEMQDGQWTFASELVREAAEAGLTRDGRVEVHYIRATVLAAQGANASAGFHYEQASTLLRHHDAERSAQLGSQAAGRLAAAGLRALTGDLVAAGDLLSRATALLPSDEPRRLALLPELARARLLSGDLVGAGEVLDEAVERSDRLGLTQAGAHARLARLDLLRSTEPDRAYAELPALVAEVLPVLQAGGDDRGLSLAWQLEASALQYRVRWGAMEQPLDRAIHHADRADDRRLLELAQSLQVGSMFHGPMHLDETRERLSAMLEHEGNSPSHRASVEARLAGTLALQGDPEAGRAGLLHVRQVFHDLGRDLSALATAFLSGPVEMLDGDPERASVLLGEACEGLLAMGDRAFTSTLASLFAEACWRTSDLPGAADAVSLSRSLAGDSDVISQVRWRSVRAKLLAREGRGQEALLMSAEAVTMVAATDEVTSQGDVLADAAEVQELLGNTEASQVLLRDAVQRYQRKGATQAIRRLSSRLQVPDLPAVPLQAFARVSDPAAG